MAKLQITKFREEEAAEAVGGSRIGGTSPNVCQSWAKMCSIADLRGNLLSMCCIWTISGFSYYLIDFYVKYFPGNVFVNKGFFGLCDIVSIFYIQMLD